MYSETNIGFVADHLESSVSVETVISFLSQFVSSIIELNSAELEPHYVVQEIRRAIILIKMMERGGESLS
jgi:hypothetical protein